MEQELKRYMDVAELSGYLGISKWMIYKYIESRDIPFIPFGRVIRFDRLAVERWTEKRTVRGLGGRPRHSRVSVDVDSEKAGQTDKMEVAHGDF